MNNMTNEAYHADKLRIGKSGLDLIHKSPAHYYAKYLDPNRVWEEPTPALAFGSALHVAVFEPTEFTKRFVIAPEINRRTSAGKEEYEQFLKNNKGKTIITDEVFQHVQKMKEKVYEHPSAAVLLESGIAEKVFHWNWEGDDDEGNPIMVRCKIKPDWLSHNGFVVDLKSTEDASPQGFGKSVWNYRYHVQGAFYSEGMAYCNDGEFPRGFIFIAVEKSPPYAVALYYLTPEHMEIGRSEYIKDLRVYHKCLQTNEWPAYGDGVIAVQLPGWAINKSKFL